MHPAVWQPCACHVASKPYSGGDAAVLLLKVEIANLGERWRGNGCKGTRPAPLASSSGLILESVSLGRYYIPNVQSGFSFWLWKTCEVR